MSFISRYISYLFMLIKVYVFLLLCSHTFTWERVQEMWRVFLEKDATLIFGIWLKVMDTTLLVYFESFIIITKCKWRISFVRHNFQFSFIIKSSFQQNVKQTSIDKRYSGKIDNWLLPQNEYPCRYEMLEFRFRFWFWVLLLWSKTVTIFIH